MQNYELLYIIPGDKTDEEVKPLTESIKQLLVQHGAQVVKQDFWGKRKLAYEIEHIRQGFYDLITFDVETDKLSALERALRLNEYVLRHQITRRIVKTPEQLAAEEQFRERIAAKRAAVKEKEVVAAVAEQTPISTEQPVAAPVSGPELEQKLEEILEEDKVDV